MTHEVKNFVSEKHDIKSRSTTGEELSLSLRHKHYKTYIRQSTQQLINSSDYSTPSAECSQGQQAMSLFSEAVIHGGQINI